jgi:NAD(P)-dependent dehydrogenase (short-subunit alcohol dehydrogenase family)
MESNKSVAVIGCAEGHGRCVASYLAKAGYSLLSFDRSVQVHDFSKEVAAIGGSNESFVIDVCNFDSLSDEFGKAIGNRRLSGLIYFPRSREQRDPLETTPDEWDRDLAVSVKGAFFCAKALLPYMQPGPERQSSIVFISSVLSQFVGVESVGYHVAKAGLEQLCRYLAVKWGNLGIRVNSLQIGVALKGQIGAHRAVLESPEFQHNVLGAHPLKRVGDSDDIAKAVEFLLSDRAAFITGHSLCLDGGLTLQEPVNLLRSLQSFPR